MNRTITSVIGVVAAVAASTILGSSAAQAAVIQIRPADLVPVPGTVSGTSGTATADFTADGIHIQTTNGSDGARGYYLIPGGTPLADVHTIQYEWSGSVAEPALVYNIDVDGDNQPDGQLMGELFYGGKDVWLNRDAGDFAGVTPTVPANYFTTQSPCNVNTNLPQNGNVDGCTPPYGGTGAHGTLDDWSRSLGNTARVVSAGFIANGLIYNGVLRSHTIGPNTYVFTNVPKLDLDPSLATCAGVETTIPGTSGNDILVGTPGNDVIATGTGADIVRGLGGDDIICGGDANDKLKGGAGNDRLYGGAGRDKLRGGAGKDFCDGGSGTDNARKCEKTTQI